MKPIAFPFLSRIFILSHTILSYSIFCTAQTGTISNDHFWNTKDGRPVYSQGGGIFKFPDATGKMKYYWYGVHYKEAGQYRNDPSVTLSTVTFESVTCYSSTDLVHWTFDADVLTPDEVVKPGTHPWIGRLGVAFIPELNKYALIVQHESEVLIALSATPTGKFKWHRKINMKDRIGTSNTGDQTVFTDEDNGKSYLIYSYGKGRNRIYVSEIGMCNGQVDLLDCHEVYKGESREGNCMFKYGGRYYMIASNIYGWDASYAYYLVADHILGPYEPVNDMQVMPGCEIDYAHVSQTGFFVSVKGSKKETIIYCGDRWANFAGNGLGYNQWVPLSFIGKTPYFHSLNAWSLNLKTGEWVVAPENNYCKNSSFEADRRYVPNAVKPLQLQLTGWNTNIIEGNALSLDTLTSPVLNHFNTQEERKWVIGEKSLHISDRVDFKRNVSQIISSTPFVPLPDGIYRLTIKIRNSSGFKRLELYAVSHMKKQSVNLSEEHNTWTEISMEHIQVRKGKVEIGVYSEGMANAFCYVDDVVFTRQNIIR